MVPTAAGNARRNAPFCACQAALRAVEVMCHPLYEGTAPVGWVLSHRKMTTPLQVLVC
jgi:hypothetical protein